MKEEIYIDSNPVDLDDDTNITLNYRSNFLSDVSKIVSNNTYSIKLPMTARNRKVIDMSHLPSCVTNWPRINHKGRYIRNGVEIVSDANVTLVEISDTIDVAMAWGNVSAFANVVNDGKTLQDLSYGEVEGTDYVVWQKSSTSRRFPDIDYGYSEAETEVWYHPAVTVKWVLDKISSDSGVLFTFPSNRSTFLDRLVIPLLEKNCPSEKSESCTVVLTPKSYSIYLYGPYFRFYILFEKNLISNYFFSTLEGDGQALGYTIGLQNNFVNAKYTIIWELECIINGPISDTMSLVVMNGEKELLSVSPTRVYGSTVQFSLDDTTELIGNFGNENGRIRFAITGVTKENSITDLSGNVKIVPKTVVCANSEVGYDNKYYFVSNLPDIKQIDFIKAISALAGMFAIPSDTGIRFITMEELLGNKGKAVDWTKRVVASYRDNRPKVISFSLDGFAQENVYKWKDDDEGRYDGIIHVDDDTLEDEAEVITIPFAGTENKRNRAYIPLYSYDENGELQYDDGVTPRLLMFTGEYSLVAKFDGLDWESIIAKNYIAYQGVVRQPKVITELIMISEYELRELDMSVPVYLSQYGKYYAIITIKAEKSGICECKLCQLED